MTTAGELRRWLIDEIAELCGLNADEVDPRAPLDEYGLSSRDAVELSGGLEDLLDRRLPTTLVWEFPTIERLAAGLVGEGRPTPEVLPTTEERPTTSPKDPIAVVGLGCRLPGGVHGPAQFWRLLTEGLEAVSEVTSDRWADYPHAPDGTTRWGGFLDDVAGFDAEFFGIAPREAARMDPQQRMVLEVAWEALEHAGIAPDSLRGTRTGVFIGISGTEYGALSLADLAGVDAWVGTGAALAIAANRLSYVLDLRGPSLSVDTACSSSLTSFHLAVQSLRSGESDLAVVGGANLLLGPGVTASFDEMGISSADGRCKPFAANADGIARAEGVGIVVLKRLSQAHADGDRVLALVRGSATNCDGRSHGLTAPNPEAQQALLRSAYQQAGINPADVDYVEAHGTGTLLGDPIEAGALGAVLGAGRPAEHPLLLGSVKSNLGHLEAAAGIVGLIKVVLSLQHGEIPASLHYASPSPHIAFDELGLSVVDSSRSWPERDRPSVAGVSGFGFGGSNAHVVLEQAPPEQPEPVAESAERHRRFLLGAPDAGRLRDTAGQLAAWLDKHGADTSLADVERTLVRRLHGRSRAAVAARHIGDLLTGLRSLALGEESSSTASGTGREDHAGIVFVFSGHGSQWAGMGRQLLADEPVFADAVRRLDPLIRAESGFSLHEDLLTGTDAVTMDHVQPLLFGIQVALAELWRSHGVRPAAVIGHSFGEVAAAVVAGALSEQEGAKIIALRSRLLASLAGNGAMALLELSAAETAELVDELSDVDIAGLSSPNQTVIAGQAEQVRQVVAEVDARGLLAKLVKLDVAAHSPIVDQVIGTLTDGLAGLSTGSLDVTFYSTALTDPRETPDFDAAYWATNLRQPVRFAGAVAAAAADGFGCFVEISPHPVLRHALADNLAASGQNGALVLSTLRKGANETTHFHTQLATLELTGDALADRAEGEIIDLPTTPWRHVRHWLPRSATTTPARQHPLLGTHVELPEDDKHVWKAELGSAAQPWLAEHNELLSGSAYVEMANAAARTVFAVTAERIAVNSLTMHLPLPLDEVTPVTITLSLTGSDKAKITAHTKAPDGTWRLHASADIVVSHEQAADEKLCGLNQPAGRRNLVAEVSLPVTMSRDPRLRLHPFLIDACLRAVGTASHPSGDQRDSYLPIEFGSVRVYGELARGERVRASVITDEAGLVGDLHLVDSLDQVLLVLENVALGRVAATVTTAEKPLGWCGLENLKTLPAAEARSVAAEQLRTRIASVLGFAPGQLNTEAPLVALGVDSLLAVRIRNAVQHDFEVTLPTSLLLRGASVTEAAKSLFADLEIDTFADERPAASFLMGPRDAAERLVTQVWTDVLHTDVGVCQDFYAVGGDQEKAERVTAKLSELTGLEFSMPDLFRCPTIERMAGHVRDADHDPSPLRVLRPHGTAHPLFFFHPAGGDTAVYRQLSELLDPSIPIYGLDRRDGDPSVEEKVSQYLPELRKAQPHGPYRFAGWSYGGHLAFEAAQQLRRAGEEVEVVALIDAIVPLPNTSGLSDEQLLTNRLKRFGEFLESSYGKKLHLPYEELARLGEEEQAQLLVDTIRRSGLIDSAVSGAILEHQRTSFLDARALERYHQAPYDGRVVFFSPTEVVPDGLLDQRFHRLDPARGWDSVCTDLELITISGHHLSLLDPPNVEQIAKHLDAVLAGTRRLVGTGGN